MRVAVVTWRIDPRRGGAETSTLQFITRLGELGCDVVAVTGEVLEPPEGIDLRPIATGRGPRSWRLRRFLARAAAVARDAGADIVHALVPCTGADIYQPRGGTIRATVRANLRRCRSSLTRTLRSAGFALNPRQRVLDAAERLLLAPHNSVHVVAVSRLAAEDIRRDYPVPPERLHVVFNGVEPLDTEAPEVRARVPCLREAVGAHPDDLVVLAVAHNFRLKGLPSAVRCLARLPADLRRRTRLVVIGRDDPHRLLRLARRCGVRDCVHAIGATTRMDAWLAAADLLIHPTWYDPCSRVVLEALCAGVPCVTTRYNGAAEAIAGPPAGCVVDSPEDIDALAEAVTRLADPETRDACRRRAADLRERLGMRRHAEEMLRLYAAIRTGAPAAANARRSGP